MDCALRPVGRGPRMQSENMNAIAMGLEFSRRLGAAARHPRAKAGRGATNESGGQKKGAVREARYVTSQRGQSRAVGGRLRRVSSGRVS